MKKLLFSLFTIICLHSFAQEVVINDANAEKRTLSGSFSAIHISDGIDLLLTQGTVESVAVSASEEKFLARLKTEVVNGTLKIYYDNSTMVWNNNERRKLKAYVSFKTLDKLKASSGASVKVSGKLNLNSLDVQLSSGARMEGEVNIANLEVDGNSGAEAVLKGTAERLNTKVSSGAIFKGYELAANYCEAKASSGGEVRVTVNKELDAHASSGGSIRYKGEGVIKDLDVNSGGAVKRA